MTPPIASRVMIATGSSILTGDARSIIADVLMIAAIIGSVALPLSRWLAGAIRRTVRDEVEPLRHALEGHQRFLEQLAKGPLAQLLPNGGSSLRDAVEDIRTMLKGKP